MNVKYFGELSPDNVESYYECQVVIDDVELDIDLNFEENSIDLSSLEKVNTFLENINSNINLAIRLISDDYDLEDDSETARDFLAHHLEVLPKKDITSLFDSEDVTKEEFISSLIAYRVGFYPEDEESFVIIDVSFKGDVTNYLMAVTLNEKYEISYISMDN